MADILWCQVFAFKNMAKMAVAVGTEDFRSIAVGIGFPSHGALNLVIESRPAAT